MVQNHSSLVLSQHIFLNNLLILKVVYGHCRKFRNSGDAFQRKLKLPVYQLGLFQLQGIETDSVLSKKVLKESLLKEYQELKINMTRLKMGGTKGWSKGPGRRKPKAICS